jgi:hypothetical protein
MQNIQSRVQDSASPDPAPRQSFHFDGVETSMFSDAQACFVM